MGLFDKNPAPPSQPLAPPPSYNAGGSSSSVNSGAYGSDKKEPFPPPPAAESPYQTGQAGPSYQAAYGAVLLSSSDKIRLLNFPEHVIGVVGDTITRAWPPGIQTRGRLEYGGFEFKLKGRPCECLPLWTARWLGCAAPQRSSVQGSRCAVCVVRFARGRHV